MHVRGRLHVRQLPTLTSPGVYADGGGLYLRVRPSGTRAWIYVCMIKGRRREMGLGSILDVSLAKAREKAAEARAAFLEGRDPIAERAAAAAPAIAPITFGAFYALADCRQFGLEFGRNRVRDFVDAATALTERLKADFPLAHPDHPDLAFLYGTILTDGGLGQDAPTRNVCVFADAEVDRSPTGSGVTARLASMYAKGEIALGESRSFESIVGSRFTGAVARAVRAGTHDAIIARVGGRAFYSGRAEFWLEEDDELGRGFLLR